MTRDQRELGRRLRRAREAHGLTLRALGELADVNWMVVHRMETVNSNVWRLPTLEALQRIAYVLGLSFERLQKLAGGPRRLGKERAA